MTTFEWALEADDDWQAELEHAFGRAACDARYERRGRGISDEGQKVNLAVRAAYLRRYAAMSAWRAEIAAGGGGWLLNAV